MRASVGLVFAVTSGIASAQVPEPRQPVSRQLVPFAGAEIAWFGRSGQQDRLTFYSYWTGFHGDDARLHWVVRRDSNARAIPSTTWLWSDTCPALVEAMGSFEIGNTGFSAQPHPPTEPMSQDGDSVIVSSYDFHSMTFWAQLASTRVETKGPMPTEGAGGLVYRIVNIFDDGGCVVTAEPEIPKPTG